MTAKEVKEELLIDRAARRAAEAVLLVAALLFVSGIALGVIR